MSKRVPSESLLNSGPLRDRTNVSSQNGLAPERCPATVPSACKNPVVWLVVTAYSTPFDERFQNSWMNRYRFLRCFSFARSDPP